MNYIFFGTPQFAVIILQALLEGGYIPTLIVTAPDKPKGRGHILTPPPVKILAGKHGIPVRQPITLKDSNIINAIAALQPDLFVVAAYGKIIPKIILAIPKKGGANVHPSLLPRYRGPSPIQTAILNGDETTGVTIMLMDEEMDHGPILAQQEWGISNFQFPISNFTAEKLAEKLGELGAQLLIETISRWLAGEITPREQDHTKATYTKIITKEDGRIDWRKSAEKIERMVRAYTPWPSAWTTLCDTKGRTKKAGPLKHCSPGEALTKSGRRREMRVKILQSKVLQSKVLQFLAIAKNCYFLHDNKNKNNKSIDKPGTIIKENSDLLVACGKDFLMIEKLQVEGGKPTSGKEFLNAYPFARLFSSVLSEDLQQPSQ